MFSSLPPPPSLSPPPLIPPPLPPPHAVAPLFYGMGVDVTVAQRVLTTPPTAAPTSHVSTHTPTAPPSSAAPTNSPTPPSTASPTSSSRWPPPPQPSPPMVQTFFYGIIGVVPSTELVSLVPPTTAPTSTPTTPPTASPPIDAPTAAPSTPAPATVAPSAAPSTAAPTPPPTEAPPSLPPPHHPPPPPPPAPPLPRALPRRRPSPASWADAANHWVQTEWRYAAVAGAGIVLFCCCCVGGCVLHRAHHPVVGPLARYAADSEREAGGPHAPLVADPHYTPATHNLLTPAYQLAPPGPSRLASQLAARDQGKHAREAAERWLPLSLLPHSYLSPSSRRRCSGSASPLALVPPSRRRRGRLHGPLFVELL